MNNIEAYKIIDTSDLHARYEELQEKFDVDPLSLDSEEQSDWNELLELENNISEFWYGETMVPEDEFTEYAQQLAEDVGYIGPDTSWPFNHIDWESAADELRDDYTEFEWRGQTYLARA